MGVCVFSDGFLWFFGYWIPAFAGMTAVGLVGAARMTGALRDSRLEYIIFFRGGGDFTLADGFGGGGVWVGADGLAEAAIFKDYLEV